MAVIPELPEMASSQLQNAAPKVPCYAVLTRRDDREVLLSTDTVSPEVPMVEIPTRQRTASSVTAAIHRRLGVTAICRFEVPIQDLAPATRCVVLEIPEGESVRGSVAWTQARDIAWSSIAPPQARDVLWRAMAAATSYTIGRSAGNFVRTGWLSEVRLWASSVLANHGLRLGRACTQYNMGPDFALIRFEACRGDVWFKAVGKPNCREFGITRHLAQLKLPHLAPILAMHEGWRAWLTFDCGADFVQSAPALARWEAAARDLAELQIASLGWSRSLLEAGARDLRTDALQERVAPFFSVIEILMRQQMNVPPARLDPNELHALSELVAKTIDALAATRFPAALGHLDLNPGNLVVARNGTVFLDWAEAFVGHPLFAFQYLAEHSRRACGSEALEARLLTGYLLPWRTVVSDRAIRRALEIGPLLSVFACATSNEPWTDPRVLDDTGAGKYLRSLTRRMHHEARLLSERSLRCQN